MIRVDIPVYPLTPRTIVEQEIFRVSFIFPEFREYRPIEDLLPLLSEREHEMTTWILNQKFKGSFFKIRPYGRHNIPVFGGIGPKKVCVQETWRGELVMLDKQDQMMFKLAWGGK